MEKEKKISKKKAALIIQRFARGWLVRHFFHKYKAWISKKKEDKIVFTRMYVHHLREILRRHGVTDQKIYIDAREIYEYTVKKARHWSRNGTPSWRAFFTFLESVEQLFLSRSHALGYEVHFDKFAVGGYLAYGEMPAYFDGIGLSPTQIEINSAMQKILDKDEDIRLHKYNKPEVLDIALHIYAPRGTHLKNTRISTWLHPVVDNDNALLLLGDLSPKAAKLGKCIKLVAKSMKEQTTKTQREPVLSPSEELFIALRDGKSLPAKTPTKKKGKTKKKKRK